MATRQYVGARYVPKFAGEWNGALAYEGLTIVSYQGNSWTSKKPVPANTSIFNEEYWVNTGNYNAQVEAINNRVSAVEERVDGLTINVDNFGAVGDGFTDDSAAFNAAFEAAKNGAYVVTCSKNKVYAIANSVFVTSSIDFNGCTIKPTNSSVKSFVIRPEAYSDIEITNNELSIGSVSDNRLFGKVFTVRSPLSLGVREGYTTSIYHEQCVVTDNTGKITNAEYSPNIVTGNYVAANVHSLGAAINIKNATIDLSSFNVTMQDVFSCNRSNVVFENFRIVGSMNVTGYSNSVFGLHDCAFITIIGVTGNTPFNAESGYVVGLFSTSNVVIDRCCIYDNVENSWGCVGSNFITNTTFKNSVLNRIDNHYETFGYLIVEGCSFEQFRFCGGYGNIDIKDCTIYGSAYRPIEQRTDLALMLSGYIRISNVENNNTTSLLSINNRNVQDNFGELNYQKTVVTLDSIRTNINFGTLATFNCVDNNYSGKVYFIVKNTKAEINTFAQNSGTGILGHILIDGNVNSRSANIVTENGCNVTVINSNIGAINTPIAGDMLLCSNNILGNVTNANFNNVNITNNFITRDVAFSNTTDAAHSKVNNNIITTSTQNNAASWNL